MQNVRSSILLLGLAGWLAMSPSAFGYKLATKASPEERQLAGITNSYWTSALSYIAARGMPLLTEPVHEEITNRIFGCNGDVCSGSSATQAPAAVLAGVRWNDDPPFRLTVDQARNTDCKSKQTIRFETQPGCWIELFRAAERGLRTAPAMGPGTPCCTGRISVICSSCTRWRRRTESWQGIPRRA